MQITLDAVEKANDAFVEAWNSGKIEEACQLYAEDARYVTPKGITLGKQEIIERYLANIRDRKAMGQLSLYIIDFRLPPSSEGKIAHVISHWKLNNQGTVSEGFVVEVFELVGDELRITQDVSM